MDKNTIAQKIEKIKKGDVILTDIELMDGTLIQFIDEYMIIHTVTFVSRMFIGRHPTIELNKDIWGCEYLKIGYEYLLVKPKDIRTIDLIEEN